MLSVKNLQGQSTEYYKVIIVTYNSVIINAISVRIMLQGGPLQHVLFVLHVTFNIKLKVFATVVSLTNVMLVIDID